MLELRWCVRWIGARSNRGSGEDVSGISGCSRGVSERSEILVSLISEEKLDRSYVVVNDVTEVETTSVTTGAVITDVVVVVVETSV